MMAPLSEVLSRFMRIGTLIATLGAFHTFTLLLSWFAVTYDGFRSQTLSGYGLNESLLLSLTAGALAGSAGVVSSLSRNLSMIKVTVPVVAALSGALAVTSPAYSFLIKMPRFGVDYNPEVGVFAAVFSGVAILGAGITAGIISISTRTQQAQLNFYGYQGYQEPAIYEPTQGAEQDLAEQVELAPQAEETASYSPADGFPSDAECSICYDKLTQEGVVSCTSCGTFFHKDCAEALAELEGLCPNCGLKLTR